MKTIPLRFDEEIEIKVEYLKGATFVVTSNKAIINAIIIAEYVLKNYPIIKEYGLKVK